MDPAAPNEDWPLHELTWGRRVIVVADVVESVRLMQEDEAGFIERWRQFLHQVRSEVLHRHGGTLVKSLGDGLLIQFGAASDAVAASMQMLELSIQRLVQLRVGIHSADVVMDDLDVYGSGVNLAARLGTLARPGEIVVSSGVRDALADGVHGRIVDLGECYLKHIEPAVRAFRIEATRREPPSGPTQPPSPQSILARVAVLPFEHIVSSPGSGAMGAALADAVIACLCRVPGVQVISRLSTAALAREADAVAACAHHLGAHFVISGTCELDGERARGVVHATDARGACLLWTDGFDVSVRDLFLGIDAGLMRMARDISRAIAAVSVQRARQMPVPNLESFTLYIAGVALLHRLSRNDFMRSHELLGALCERQPRAAAPVAMLAKWHMLRVLQGWAKDPAESASQGLALCSQALDKEPDHPLALAITGLLGVHFGHDLQGARSLAVAAIEADPQEPNGWMTLAGIDGYLERGSDAIAHARRAIELSPLDPCRYLFDLLLGAGQLASGHTNEAIESVAASMRLNAVHAPTYRLAAIANMLGGRPEQARDAAKKLMELDPGFRIRSFVERYPGRHQAHASDYARALKEAGLPP